MEFLLSIWGFFVDGFAQYITAINIVSFISMVIGCLYYIHRQTIKDSLNPENKEDGKLTGLETKMASINHAGFSSWRDLHKKIVGDLLDGLDNKLGKIDINKSKLFLYSGVLTHKGLNISVMLAYVYPIILVMLVWIFTGINSSGIDNLLSETIAVWQRLIYFLLLALGIFAFIQYYKMTGYRKIIWLIVAAVVALALAFALAGAGALALVFAGAGAGALAGALALALVLAGALALVFAGAGAGALAGALALVFAGAGAGAISFGIVASFAFVSLLSQGRPVFAWLFLIFMVGVYLSFVNFFADQQELIASSQFTVFFVIFPLINGIFDWLSIAITRDLLRRGNHKGGWYYLGYSLLDVILAIFCLFALVVILVLVMSGLNYLSMHGRSGVLFYDLAGLFKGLHGSEVGDSGSSGSGIFGLYFWVYAMIFSTFIPSFVHATIALSSLMQIKLPMLFTLAKKQYDKPLKTDAMARFLLASIFTLHNIIFMVFPLLIVCGLFIVIFMLLPVMGSTLLSLAENFAILLGMISN